MKITEQMLAEQMQLTEREIEKRKLLFRITDADRDLLILCRPYIEQRIESIVDHFYEYQLAIPEIDLLIGDAETLRRLRSSMGHYVLELFDGQYGSEYVNKRLRIGKVHKRIGVAPKLYISTVNILHDLLIAELEAVVESIFAEGQEKQLKLALRKVLMFDVELVFDTYINSLVAEVTAAKAEVEQYAESLEETVAIRTKQLQEISRRDPLTNLLNRKAFSEELQRELARAKREQGTMTLAYIDLNGFKLVNDQKGHIEGDRILQIVSKILVECSRESDIPCRYGGDEFTLVMPDSDEEQSRAVFARMSERIAAVAPDTVTLSVGVQQAGPEVYPAIEDFIREADSAMYLAKAQSKEEPGSYIVLGSGGLIAV